MNIRFCAALLLAVLAIPFFTGCAANAAQLDAAEEVIENRLDLAEDALASRIGASVAKPAAPAATEASLLTKEEAEKIALEHAGFTAGQVQGLRTELDYERGMPEYDVDFHVDRFEYDYEIDAQTGKILDWDKDRDD